MMKNKGFTLVELLVVIAILAILATVSVVGYTQYIQNADAAVAKEDLVQARTAVMAADIVGDYSNKIAFNTDGNLVWTEDKVADVVADLKDITGLEGVFTIYGTKIEGAAAEGGTKPVVGFTITHVGYKTTNSDVVVYWTVAAGTVDTLTTAPTTLLAD